VYVFRQNCRAAGWRWDTKNDNDIHFKHNIPDIIILNKQQKQAFLLDIAVPNSHNITQKLINI
jgi:hypothetical protein